MPTPLETLDMKDLTKGMISTTPSTSVPLGGFKRIKDFYVTPNGLQRRDSWRIFFPNKENYARVPITEGEVVTDLESFFDKNNALQLLAFSTKRLYVNKDGSSFYPVPFGQASYTITEVTSEGAKFETQSASTAAGAGSINGTVFTDTVHGTGIFKVGTMLVGAGIPYGLHITEKITGTGANNLGTYKVSETLTVNNITITGIDTDFTNDGILANDVVRLALTPTTWVEALITLVPTRTELKFTASTEIFVGQSMFVIREFPINASEERMVDYTLAPSSIIMVDGSDRGIWRYDGVSLKNMNVHGDVADVALGLGNYLKGAYAVYYYNGYLIIGNTIEKYNDSTLNVENDTKRTLRWASVSDMSEFAIKDYIIFTREQSEIIKISSVEECPIVFLSNAIYYGSPSELEGLPYAYTKIESGAISAVGARAMCSVPGGMVFVAQKNIYFMEVTRQGSRIPTIQPIGDSIYNEANLLNNSPKFTKVLFSPQQNMLMCGFPKTKKRLGRIFCLSGETKTWSYLDDDTSRFTCASVFPYFILLRWSDVDAVNWDTYNDVTWFTQKLKDYTSRVFAVDTNGYIYVADNSYNWDEAPYNGGIVKVPFECQIESGDLDFGTTSNYKVLTQMFFTLADVATRERKTDILIKIEISTDRGKSWVEKGLVLVENGTFLEDAHLRAVGEVIRFRLTFGANSPLFTLAEVALRLRRMGSYVQRGP